MLKLKEIRKSNGLSQQELANKLKITQATLSGWENEKYEIDNASLIKCAQIFDTTTDAILGIKGPENKPTDSIAYSVNEFEYNLIKSYRTHPEHQASINALLGISPADNVTKLQNNSSPAFVAAASGTEYKATEPDTKKLIEIEELEKKHNK